MIYLDLFIGFLKVGCFAFGGAYGAIPLIREVVLSYGWLNDETLSYMIAVSESTPGPIMVNMATYIGSSQGGFFGALIATAAVVLPAFCIILLVTEIMKAVLKNPYVQALFHGLNPCIIGIILATGGYMVYDNCLTDGHIDLKAAAMTLFLGLIFFGFQKGQKKKLSPIAFIVISAIAGIIVYGM